MLKKKLELACQSMISCFQPHYKKVEMKNDHKRIVMNNKTSILFVLVSFYIISFIFLTINNFFSPNHKTIMFDKPQTEAYYQNDANIPLRTTNTIDLDSEVKVKKKNNIGSVLDEAIANNNFSDEEKAAMNNLKNEIANALNSHKVSVSADDIKTLQEMTKPISLK